MLEFLDQIVRPINFYKSIRSERNIFTNISAVFYRENFHSDILAYYFQDELVKKKLIEWINSSLKGESLVFEDYRTGEVMREQGRIDISIYSSDGTKVILIENKSNDASDQYRQLPGYYQKLREKGIEVEAILYLNKGSLKKPSLDGWSTLEKQAISSLLVPAQLIGIDSFCTRVIDGVLTESTDIKLSGISLEIKALFQNVVLGGINMEDLSAFVAELQDDNNLEKLKKTIVAYNDLPRYWREYYKHFLEGHQKDGKINSSFTIGSWKDTCIVVRNTCINGIRFSFDLWFWHDHVEYSFWTIDGKSSEAAELKEKMGSSWGFGNERADGSYGFSNPNVFKEDEIKNQIISIISGLEKFI